MRSDDDVGTFGEEGRCAGAVDILPLALAATFFEVRPIIPSCAEHVAAEAIDGGQEPRARQRNTRRIRQVGGRPRHAVLAACNQLDHVAARRGKDENLLRLDDAEADGAVMVKSGEAHEILSRSERRRWR